MRALAIGLMLPLAFGLGLWLGALTMERRYVQGMDALARQIAACEDKSNVEEVENADSYRHSDY